MGVETIAYSVQPEKLRKIRKDHELLEIILGFSDEEDAEWTFENYSFGRVWEEYADILGSCGFSSFKKKLNPEKYWDSDSYEVWSVAPKDVEKVAKDLETADFETLKASALEKRITDYYGKEIPENMYDYYIGDIEEVKAFLKAVAEKGNFLLFSTM